VLYINKNNYLKTLIKILSHYNTFMLSTVRQVYFSELLLLVTYVGKQWPFQYIFSLLPVRIPTAVLFIIFQGFTRFAHSPLWKIKSAARHFKDTAHLYAAVESVS